MINVIWSISFHTSKKIKWFFYPLCAKCLNFFSLLLALTFCCFHSLSKFLLCSLKLNGNSLFCCSPFLWLILFELAWCTDLLFMKVSNHTTESYWSEGRVVVMVKEINHCCLTFYRREQSQTRSNLLNNTGETNSVIARAEANNICLIRHFPVSGEMQYKEPCFWSIEEMSMVKNIKVNLTLTGWENNFTNVCLPQYYQALGQTPQ